MKRWYLFLFVAVTSCASGSQPRDSCTRTEERQYDIVVADLGLDPTNCLVLCNWASGARPVQCSIASSDLGVEQVHCRLEACGLH